MGLFLRFTGVVALVIGVGAGLAVARPAWLEDMGLGFWNLPQVSTSFFKEEGRKAQLDQTFERLQSQARDRERIVRDLIDQRIDLQESVDQLYHYVDLVVLRDCMDGLELTGQTEDERMARLLVLWVQDALANEPQRAAAVVSRLNVQLREQFPQPSA